MLCTAPHLMSDVQRCFVWEGVTNYLSPEDVDGVLRQISKSASGNILLFTYVDRKVLEHPDQFFGARKLLTRLRSYGEPWGNDPFRQYGLTRIGPGPPSTHQLLAAHPSGGVELNQFVAETRLPTDCWRRLRGAP
jgi:hypothetical protein